MDRRGFLKLFGAGLVTLATPKIIVDMGANLFRRESGIIEYVPVDLNFDDLSCLFKKVYGDMAVNMYCSDNPIMTRIMSRYDLQGLKEGISIPIIE